MRLSTQTVRLAASSFTRHPGFTIVAVLSLGLAIALNTTMYSVLDAMISPTLDMREASDVYGIALWGDTRHRVDDATRASLLRSGLHAFQEVSFEKMDRSAVAVEYGRQYKLSASAIVEANYFAMLGAHPLAGRYFGDADITATSLPTLISDRLAHVLFVGGQSAVGKVIDVDGAPHTVIGVLRTLPGDRVDLWTLPPRDVVVSAQPPTIVRLRHGVSKEEADAELAVVGARLARLAGEKPKDVWYQLTSATSSQFHYKGFHFALIGSVFAVLLIACANLANLQLARGIGRSRELAVRAALGASRADIIAQLLVESAMLAVVGLGLGLLATLWATDLLRWHIPPAVAEYFVAPQTSWRVFAFAMIACGVCVLIVGLLPAIRISRVDPNELLKAGAGTGASSKHRRQYGLMVAAQIGLSLALLSATALVVRQAARVREIQPGFDLKPLTQSVVWVWPAHDTTIAVAAQFNAVAAALRAEPRVADVAVYTGRQVLHHAITIVTSDRTVRQIAAPLQTYTVVSSSYLRTQRWSVVAGRDFIDGIPSAPEVIIDKLTARSLWPGADPIGAQIKLGADSTNAPWVRVVGVVPDQMSPEAMWGNIPPTTKTFRIGHIYYLPDSHDSVARPHRAPIGYTIITRASSDFQRMPITMHRALTAFVPGGLIWSQTMEDAIGVVAQRQGHDFVAGMFALFTALALGLTAFGVYGIVAHSVAERRRELGVRVALGATSKNILSVVLREGNVFALAGVAVGLWLTKDSVWWFRAFSLEDDAYNAPLFAAMAALLFSVALVAALVPAMRATRIDPVESLRNE